ncbi:MAG TPA: LysM peptidoglycan-binding domain-containing protein [Opitutaceae bacterium]|nr:LysM peptidoglycan-binding domain-containing protein [Opitutaceae bacterium]
MWKCLFLGCAMAVAARAQNGPSAVDFANLREDVRGLTQRVDELRLKVEQLERENADLRQKASTADRAYATAAQLNEAVSDMNRNVRTAVGASQKETLEKIAEQMEKLAKQTNAAIESLAKGHGAKSAGEFAENFSKQGISYTVQKGDTLAVIAKKTGAKQQDIINANKISDPSHITVGQTLFIPGGK